MDSWSLQRLAARLDGMPELAHLLHTVARLDWEGCPDPCGEALRDLDTNALVAHSVRLAVVIVNRAEPAADLQRLRGSLVEELERRLP